MIKEQAENAQFIAVTQNREMIATSTAIWGVSFSAATKACTRAWRTHLPPR
jgi:chromosome segregation ATPase